MHEPELEILAAAGVPLGAPRPAPRALPEPDLLRRAVFDVVPAMSAEDRIPCVAWLAGFRHHWPTRFRELFGHRGELLVEELRESVPDANRYLKLRRIAIENLAGVV